MRRLSGLDGRRARTVGQVDPALHLAQFLVRLISRMFGWFEVGYFLPQHDDPFIRACPPGRMKTGCAHKVCVVPHIITGAVWLA